MPARPSVRVRSPTFGLLLLAAACAHAPSEKDQKLSQIHYDLGVNAQQAGNVQSAVAEFEQALALDEGFPEAHNALALVLHLSYRRLDDAEQHYKRALAIRPAFSEAKVNLGSLYLDESRWDAAIPLFEAALNDMIYPTPYIAENNLGWALFKKGDASRALDHIRAAITTKPEFCQGHRNLGIVYEAQGNLEKACAAYTRFTETCAEVAESWHLLGLCEAKRGRTEQARASFATCVRKAPSGAVHDDCAAYVQRLGGAPAGGPR